uniref:uncharacterized protein LOC122588550 isoform X2 n=1 Tax=Erigeron canadensis TaxID=72917 RepID=UPI001CB892DE|nr:uncharacterized protein LOC122588550 isoform X2 [Erigeron canadensis]
MSGREVREYTNLSDPKDKKFGKGKDRIDDEDITFQRMVAKMQEVAGERGGYLHGRGVTICSILRSKWKLKRMLNAYYAARKSEHLLPLKAASVADSSPALIPLPLRVEPKTKTGIRQQDLLKKVVEVKPKRQKVSTEPVSSECNVRVNTDDEIGPRNQSKEENEAVKVTNPIKSLLAAYQSSDDDDED